MHFRRGGGGQRDGERIPQLLARVGDVEVVGAEVVTPLGDAVSLVHGEQTQSQGLKRAEEGHIAEAFGRDVNESVFPLREESQALLLFGDGNRTVDECRGNPSAVERIHLIFHQCDKRRDDEGEAVEMQRGELVDERLARARGHDGKGVLFVEETRDRLLLSRAEGVEAEVGVEGGGEGRGRVGCCVFRVA